MSKTNPAGRVVLFDEVRGLCLILMVFYHGMLDLVTSGVDLTWFFSSVMQRFLQPAVAGTFIFISGAVSRYSRSNLRRGLAALACAFAVTAVTFFVMPATPDLFGILHLLGVCMLLFIPLRPLLDRIRPAAGICLFAVCFLATYNLPWHVVGMGPLSARLPDALYSNPYLFWLGLPAPGFVSADYFPLFPWAFIFFAGASFGVLAKKKRLPAMFYRGHCAALSRIGRHSLLIYLAHQPLLIGLFAIVLPLFGYQVAF